MASKTIRIINGGSNDDDYTCYWSETIHNINNIIKNNMSTNVEITRVGVYCSADYDGGLGSNPYKAYLQFGFGTADCINIHLLGETRITKEPTLYPSNRGLDITSYLSSRFYPWGFNTGGQERFLAIVYTSSALISRQKMEYADLVIDYTEHTHSHTPSVTKQPTCTDTGVMTYACSCGDSYTATIPALGHKYTSTVTPPTDDASGYTTYTCPNCGYSYKTNYVHRIIVKSNNENYGTVRPGRDYGDGITAELKAFPENGCKFVKWSDGDTNATKTIIVTKNATYIAYFEKLPPEFTSVSMKYLNRQISASNKVKCDEGFIISVGVT